MAGALPDHGVAGDAFEDVEASERLPEHVLVVGVLHPGRPARPMDELLGTEALNQEGAGGRRACDSGKALGASPKRAVSPA